MEEEYIGDRFLRLAEAHCSNTLAAIALVRSVDDLHELRDLRRLASVLLSEDVTGRKMTLAQLQSDLRWRHDLIAASSVIDARITELCAPDVREPEEFAKLVEDLGEDADIASGRGIVIPYLELIFGDQQKGGC